MSGKMPTRKHLLHRDGIIPSSAIDRASQQILHLCRKVAHPVHMGMHGKRLQVRSIVRRTRSIMFLDFQDGHYGMAVCGRRILSSRLSIRGKFAPQFLFALTCYHRIYLVVGLNFGFGCGENRLLVTNNQHKCAATRQINLAQRLVNGR